MQRKTACVYDMSEEDKSAKLLRGNLEKLRNELQETRALLPILANTSNREIAQKVAQEVVEKGFSEHSFESLRQIVEQGYFSDPEQTQREPTSEDADRKGRGETKQSWPSTNQEMYSQQQAGGKSDMSLDPNTQWIASDVDTSSYPSFPDPMDVPWHGIPEQEELTNIFRQSRIHSASSQGATITGGIVSEINSVLSDCRTFKQGQIANGFSRDDALGPVRLRIESEEVNSGPVDPQGHVAVVSVRLASRYLRSRSAPEKWAFAFVVNLVMRVCFPSAFSGLGSRCSLYLSILSALATSTTPLFPNGFGRHTSRRVPPTTL